MKEGMGVYLFLHILVSVLNKNNGHRHVFLHNPTKLQPIFQTKFYAKCSLLNFFYLPTTLIFSISMQTSNVHHSANCSTKIYVNEHFRSSSWEEHEDFRYSIVDRMVSTPSRVIGSLSFFDCALFRFFEQMIFNSC